jgi:hypothetical protein
MKPFPKQLNLPSFAFKYRKTADGKTEIYDSFRGKYLLLTPEEWVRQNFLRFLVELKGYPKSLLAVEKGLRVNRMQKRFDAVAFDSFGKPVLLLEFKSPDVKIDQRVFEQVAAYNLQLHVRYLIVSNGLLHYCCRIDYEKKDYSFLKSIPDYNSLDTGSAGT